MKVFHSYFTGIIWILVVDSERLSSRPSSQLEDEVLDTSEP